MEALRPAVVKFLLAQCGQELIERVMAAPNVEEHYGVSISFIQLSDADLV